MDDLRYNVLVDAILKVLQVYIKEVDLKSTFREDLGADSLDMLQIQQLVEKELNITMDDVEVANIKTVEDAYELIKKADKSL